MGPPPTRAGGVAADGRTLASVAQEQHRAAGDATNPAPSSLPTTLPPLPLVLDAARRASATVAVGEAAARRRWAALPDDALALAMARLGYVKAEIDRTRAALETEGLGPDAAIEQRLRRALQLLSGK